MKRIPTLALAAAAAVACLPGCYVISKAVPLDTSGMEYPIDNVSGAFHEQVANTRDTFTGLPHAFASHCRDCWINLSEDPADF